jgi:hypothetical protein
LTDQTADAVWVVENAKITRYLLNLDHPDGASKAKYLRGFGFTSEAPETLAAALVQHALSNPPGRTVVPPKGLSRVLFEGLVQGPDGRLLGLRTVWEIVEAQEWRFVTAVPLTR